MENKDPQPDTRPAGNRPPPRPPHRAAIGLGPEGDDSNRKCPATITKSADGEGKFIRQSGGRGHYGHVKIKSELAFTMAGMFAVKEAIKKADPFVIK